MSNNLDFTMMFKKEKKKETMSKQEVLTYVIESLEEKKIQHCKSAYWLSIIRRSYLYN